MFRSIKSRLFNLGILTLCFLYALLRGKANKESKVTNRILVIQAAKLGDMVCTTPMFRAIKQRYPEVVLCVGGNKINQSLLEHNTDVDQYFVLGQGIIADFRHIRNMQLDYVAITSPHFMYAALAYLAGIPMIVVPQVTGGFTPYETRSYKLLRSLLVVRSHRMGYYAPLEYLKLLESLDIYTTDTKKHLGFSNTATEKIDKLFIERGFIVGKDLIVGISASAGNKIKKWSAKSFAEVAVYLYQKYHAKLLIIGGKGDLGETAEMLSFLPKDIPVCNTVDRLSVDELKALISKLSLFVSVDTGPIYIAEAFGVPTVDIVGPMDEREQPPIGEKHKVVFLPDRKSPVLHIMNARVYDVVEARRQVESITVGMVTDAIDSLIQK